MGTTSSSLTSGRATRDRMFFRAWPLVTLLAVVATTTDADAQSQIQCGQTITASVVVFDNPTVFNRLGAQNPNWITYALQRDVVNRTSQVPCSMEGANCEAGNVELRPDKRPRPLVIRSVEGACLDITFTNLLAGPDNFNPAELPQYEANGAESVRTRKVA